MVVPILAYKHEWANWKREREEKEKKRKSKAGNNDSSGGDDIFGDCVEEVGSTVTADVANGGEKAEEAKADNEEEEEDKPEK